VAWICHPRGSLRSLSKEGALPAILIAKRLTDPF